MQTSTPLPIAAWYDRNAADFIRGSATLNTSRTVDRFLDGLAAGSRVLDAGCGSGRDARIFSERGFRTGAFDASREMVAAARALCGPDVPVRQLGFLDFADPAGSWDAIWSMAALLHLDPESLDIAVARLVAALAPGGRLYVSFKSGAGTRVDGFGRPFTDLDEPSLAALLARHAPDARIETWHEEALSSRGDVTLWSNALLRL